MTLTCIAYWNMITLKPIHCSRKVYHLFTYANVTDAGYSKGSVRKFENAEESGIALNGEAQK